MIGPKKPVGERNGMRGVNPGVDKARTEVTALMLMEAHAIGEQFLPFAKERGINDVAAAYRVQDAYVRRLMSTGNTQPGGFKIGLTTKKMQAMCGIDSPVAGYVAANRITSAPVTVDAMTHTHLGLEFEVAVKIGRDLPFRTIAYTQEEVATGALVAPGVELVDDRNADYATLEALSLIADNSWNAGIVVGAWAEPPADLAAVEGVVHCNGQEIGRGFGRDALGHPFIPLTWLANFRAGTDRPLKKGDIVLTGSLIRTHFPTEPSKYRYEIAGLGAVEVDVKF
jgi:2-keto-4-pentenoate hydratase